MQDNSTPPQARGIDTINNDIYHELGERWYTAQDDPVALLRAESHLLVDYVTQGLPPAPADILDVGCGGGFLSNPLARLGYRVSGIDAAESALHVAKRYDETGTVQYQTMDAYNLKFKNDSFDAVLAMDFLEHVDPDPVIGEIARCLKPGGKVFFNTFSKNPLSWLICIKGVEWFIKNTPPKLHVIDLFISPKALKKILQKHHLQPKDFRGVRPCFDRAMLSTLRTGHVHADFRFTYSNNLMLGYCGQAEKL